MLGADVKVSAFLQAASNRAEEYLSADFSRAIQDLYPCCSTLYADRNNFHNGGGIGTNLLPPAEEPLSVPLQIFLVFRRHIALICAILVRATEQPGMGCNPGSSKEYFYSAAGQADIYLLFDVFVGNGVIHLVDAYMVVILDGGNFPDG